MSCGITQTPKKKIKPNRYFVLFKKWILTGSGFNTLRNFKGRKVSSRTLWEHFDKFLDNPPPPKPLKERKQIYLKIDGTYFSKWGCCLVYKEGKEKIYWSFVLRETYFNYLHDLSDVKRLGYDVLGVTSDWHGSLVSAVSTAHFDIPHQRCLVHTKRLCRTLLTRKPETEAGKDLLEISKLLTQIKNHKDKVVWIAWLKRFEDRYQDLMNQRTYAIDPSSKKKWWYTHRKLRRAFRTLKTSIPNLFIYLDNPNIEKDTNGLESEFSHLKEKLGNHRGLKREKKENFIKWYFYLKSTYFKN